MRLHQMFECACTLTVITHCIHPLAPDSTKKNFSEGGCGRHHWGFRAIQRIKPDAEFCGCAVFWWTAALAWRSEKSARCVGGFDRTSPREVLGLAIRFSDCIAVSIAPSQVKLNNIINLATIISDNCKAIHQANSVTNPSLKAWGLKEEDSPPS